MSYYPLLKAPNCEGFIKIYNFAPNNWESKDKSKKYLNLTFINNNRWESVSLGILNYGSYKLIRENEIKHFSDSSLILASLNGSKLPRYSDELPKLDCFKTTLPENRATLGLQSKKNFITSYQGEINPFPRGASLLSFSPFMQFKNNIQNFIILVNVESSPTYRESELIIIDCLTKKILKKAKMLSNTINLINLDKLTGEQRSIKAVISKDMAAIPIYLSTYRNGLQMSLEHSHPPGSFGVHGNRFAIQKTLKDIWLNQKFIK